MRRTVLVLSLFVVGLLQTNAQDFNGINNSLGNLFRLSNAKSRSICAENRTGEKGKGGMATLKEGSAAWAARDLGQGWKVNPYLVMKKGETVTLGEISEAGCINHIWITTTGNWRFLTLRIYWDDETEPSVECPLGDFFTMGWGEFAENNSIPIAVTPGKSFNSFWQMPFRKKCKITLENIAWKDCKTYYQIDYTVGDVPDDAAYFHAQFRKREVSNYGKDFVLVDGIKGKGQYVGTYLAWQVNNNGWWGEGEIKFFMDGDKEFPTICGTGTEDYFLGSWNFDSGKKSYHAFSTPYAGLHQVIQPDGKYKANTRFGMYRWHILDPIRFEDDLKVTIQDLGWRDGGRYLKQKSDISAVTYWYQTEPHAKFPKYPSKDELEIR
jgi:hypothetical protein